MILYVIEARQRGFKRWAPLPANYSSKPNALAQIEKWLTRPVSKHSFEYRVGRYAPLERDHRESREIFGCAGEARAAKRETPRR